MRIDILGEIGMSIDEALVRLPIPNRHPLVGGHLHHIARKEDHRRHTGRQSVHPRLGVDRDLLIRHKGEAETHGHHRIEDVRLIIEGGHPHLIGNGRGLLDS